MQAVATQYFLPAPPPEDIPIIPVEDVSNLFTNQSVVSYYVQVELAQVIEFYQSAMLNQGWWDISEPGKITENAAILKYLKPDKIATITLTDNPISEQTVVLITIRTP